MSCLSLFGQSPDYYFPVNPGKQNFLAGTMGELRGSHFHGGIDVKTGGATGLPIYSTANGYVSRVKVSPYGYGNALYIYHPEHKTTSVYGHLEKYRDDIAQYILKEQYKNKTFDIELQPKPDQFIVKKGDLVAFSGNSGGSSGPHLHFEIRDDLQRPLNPLDYKFSEIKDQIPPSVRYFALVPLNSMSRVNQLFAKQEFVPSSSAGSFTYSSPISAYGDVGVMVDVYDQLDGVSNKNGVPKITLKLDGNIINNIIIDQVPFHQNRYILLYRDQEFKTKKYRNYQKLYIDNGNELPIYHQTVNHGIINIGDTLAHKVEVILKDAYDNESKLSFTVKGKKIEKSTVNSLYYEPSSVHVQGNTMVMMGKKQNGNSFLAKVYANDLVYEIEPAYFANEYSVYLWDLDRGIPDSVDVCDKTFAPDFNMKVPVGRAFDYYNEYADVSFSSTSLLQDIYLGVDYIDEFEDGKEYFLVGNEDQLLLNSAKIVLKPKMEYANKEKTCVFSTTDLKKFSYEGGTWDKNTISFKTNSLGTFTLLADTIPPNLRIINQNSSHFRCYAYDDLSGIKDYKLYIDNEWVLLQYDPKRNMFWSEKLDKSKPFKGDLKLIITDMVNNEKIYTSIID